MEPKNKRKKSMVERYASGEEFKPTDSDSTEKLDKLIEDQKTVAVKDPKQAHGAFSEPKTTPYQDLGDDFLHNFAAINSKPKPDSRNMNMKETIWNTKNVEQRRIGEPTIRFALKTCINSYGVELLGLKSGDGFEIKKTENEIEKKFFVRKATKDGFTVRVEGGNDKKPKRDMLVTNNSFLYKLMVKQYPFTEKSKTFLIDKHKDKDGWHLITSKF